MPCSTKTAVTAAFREVTLSLIGVFNAFQASPELVEASAGALAAAFRAHMTAATPPRKGTRAADPMKALLEEIDGTAIPGGVGCSCSHRK